MSIMMNIASPTNQSEKSAIGNGLAINNIGSQTSTKTTSNKSASLSNEFASLIASLLAINSAQQEQQLTGSTEAKANTTQENILATLGLDAQQLAKLNSSINGQDKNAFAALSNLFKNLENIAKSLENGTKIDPEQIDSAIASINILANLYDSIAPTPIGKNIASATGIYQAINANSQTGIASLALQGASALTSQGQTLLQTLESATQATNGAQTTKTQTNINNNQAQNTNMAVVKDLIASLTQMAQGLEKNTPELAQKITSLIEKISTATNNISANLGQAISSQASLSQTGALQAGLPQALSANLNKNKVAKANINSVNNLSSVSAAQQLSVPQTGASETLLRVVSPKPINSKIDNNQQLSNNFISQASNNILTDQNSAQSANANQNIKLDILKQIEPIISLQSNGQPALITGSAASIKPSTALYQQATQNLNLPHIAFEFASNVKAGLNRFQIQLNPPEMGRIDVKMDIDKSGTLNARLSVERVETFDLLQRDARALERALAQAGLDSSKTNLEFSLKDNPFANQDNQFADENENFANSKTCEEADEKTDIDIINQMPNAIIHRGTATFGGLNITA